MRGVARNQQHSSDGVTFVPPHVLTQRELTQRHADGTERGSSTPMRRTFIEQQALVVRTHTKKMKYKHL